jgi:Ca2+-binding EF-hand superfamily protein
MVLVIYVFSIGFTTAAMTYLVTTERWQNEDSKDLITFFGTLPGSMISLYQAMSGGNDWGAFYDALAATGLFWQLMFLCYISFAVFAVLNIVTGVFVESAVELANNDQEARIHEQLALKRKIEKELTHVFVAMDVDGNGLIHRNEFEDLLKSEKVFAVFRDMEIQADEALRLFDALDIDESGAIVAREFVEGCMDMQGTGSAYNQALMLRELADIKRMLKKSAPTNTGSADKDPKGTLLKDEEVDLCSADTTTLTGEEIVEDL